MGEDWRIAGKEQHFCRLELQLGLFELLQYSLELAEVVVLSLSREDNILQIDRASIPRLAREYNFSSC